MLGKKSAGGEENGIRASVWKHKGKFDFDDFGYTYLVVNW